MMKNILLLIVPAFFAQATSAQNFAVGHIQKTFTDASRANRQVSCEIYYPALSAGDNVPVAAGKFPVLAFGHGFVMTWSAYDIYWLALAPRGYIMVFPTTESSFAPSHANFGKDLAFLCQALKNEGNSSASLFFGAVDSTNAVMGHSMGGGCAFLAMQYDSSITAMATVAAAVTNPSSVTAAASITRPSLVLAGLNDCVAPPAEHQLPMYNALSSMCKSYIGITGGDHCQFASFNTLCSFGQSTCSPQGDISAATQQSLVFEYLLPWLDFYLKHDCAAGERFQESVAAGNGVSPQQNCTLECAETSVTTASVSTTYLLYPNPAASTLHIHSRSAAEPQAYRICSMTGRVVLRGELASDHNVIDIRQLPPGLYGVYLNGGAAATFVVQR